MSGIRGKHKSCPMRAALMILVAVSAAVAQSGAPEIKFDSVPNPLKFPANIYFGEAVSYTHLSSRAGRGKTHVLRPTYATGRSYGRGHRLF